MQLTLILLLPLFNLFIVYSQGVEFAAKLAGFNFDSHLKTSKQQKLLILGAGLSRTGTKSLKQALSKLGYKVAHTEDLMSEGLGELFEKALRDDAALDEFLKELLNLGYNATVDIPFALLTPKLFDRFPDAKIILTTREPEEWAKSFLRTCNRLTWFSHLPFVSYNWFFDILDLYGNGFTLRGVKCAKDPLFRYFPWMRNSNCGVVGLGMSPEEFYHRHNKMITELPIKSENLLVYDIRAGWTPLLSFFQRDNDSLILSPFPNLNDRYQIAISSNIAFFYAFGWPFVLLFTLSSLISFLFQIFMSH